MNWVLFFLGEALQSAKTHRHHNPWTKSLERRLSKP